MTDNVSSEDQEAAIKIATRMLKYFYSANRKITRKQEKFLRKYGTTIPIIKAVILLKDGIHIAVQHDKELKELVIPVEEKIENYQKLIKANKIYHIFNEDTLTIDLYTRSEGIVLSLDISEFLFELLL